MDNTGLDGNARAMLMTYACQQGEPLPADKSLAKELVTHLNEVLQRDQGCIDLNQFLLALPSSVGMT